MAKSVLDSGWATFKAMLNYKASRHSALFLEVDERFTTVSCSVCGAHGGPKGIAGLRIREWVCSECGSRHDRDVNSARNILAIGRSAAPPVGESRNAYGHNILCSYVSTG
jgi:transposase